MINKAIIFATRAHKGCFRKGSNMPYIIHPLEVAVIVSQIVYDEELIVAALLHDTVEDCPNVELEEIEEQFGRRVALLVESESEDKTKSWKERKSTTIEFLATKAEDGTKIIALADKLANIRAIHRDHKIMGDEVWEKFTVKDKSEIGWYYKGLRNSLISMEKYPAYQEYISLVEEVFGE